MNLLCGSLAVMYAMQLQYIAVWILCILAAVFDFFDGFAARKLGAYSPLGKELDSLCDLVSFGLAPAIALIMTYRNIEGTPYVLSFIPLSIVACSALRLAKFNLDERQTKSFLGLPTPACGLLVVSLTAFQPGILHNIWFVPATSAILAYLLVCEIPMFSMKQRSNKLVVFFSGIIILIIVNVFISLTVSQWWTTVAECMFHIFVWYIIINLIPSKK